MNTRRTKVISNLHHGYSMVELSVVLVVVGILALLLIRTINASRAPIDRAEILQQLAQAQQTVDAFVLRNHRLPCAAIAGDGNEVCGSAQAIALPWRALGLPSSFSALRYGVDRGFTGGADLAALPAPAISPTLVSSYPGLGALPAYKEFSPGNRAAAEAASVAYQAAVNNALGLTTLVNGLDWCHVLRQKVRVPEGFAVGAGSNIASVAYALAHPGSDRSFSGLNAAARLVAADVYIDSPARVQSADYDDVVWATGHAELLARIGCNVRLAQALVSAQEAYAAYDNARLLEKHWLMVDQNVETAKGAVADAGVGLSMAGLGLTLSAASLALSIAGAANTELATVFQIVVAAASVVVATAQLAVAGVDLDVAIKDLAAAKEKIANTNDYVIGTFQQYTATTGRAVSINQKGLNP